MVREKNKRLSDNSECTNIKAQVLELIKLRINNKFYDRDEILQKVVQEIYESNILEK